MNQLNFNRNFDQRLNEQMTEKFGDDLLEALENVPTEDQQDGESIFLDTTGETAVLKVSGIQ